MVTQWSCGHSVRLCDRTKINTHQRSSPENQLFNYAGLYLSCVEQYELYMTLNKLRMPPQLERNSDLSALKKRRCCFSLKIPSANMLILSLLTHGQGWGVWPPARRETGTRRHRHTTSGTSLHTQCDCSVLLKNSLNHNGNEAEDSYWL